MQPISISTATDVSVREGELPLLVPRPVWDALSEEQHAVYRAAQLVLDVVSDHETVTLGWVLRATDQGSDRVLQGLQLLDALDLVTVGRGHSDVLIRILARPEANVRITGLDGRPQWVFVARPVTEPAVPRSQLN